ncbi:MAG TPA: amidohydrolase family protein [Candidatus Acidoferrales bacterium]
MRKSFVAAVSIVITFSVAGAAAQQPGTAANFIRESAPIIVLTHAQLIDGTGSAPLSDQAVVLDHGKITAVGSTASMQIPSGAKVIDATGKTVIPGIVGMHEHIFYPSTADGPLTAVEQFYSFPPLYLASGVTTARTTGSMDPYGDLAVKANVDSGKILGPNFYLSTPYLEGAPALIPQMHELKDADEARAFVRYWHSVGFTSVKAYVDVTPGELRAGIDEAHKLNMKVTGHICSVGYNEAAEMGIDNLEHGPFGAPDGELYAKRQPGICGPDYFAEVKDIVMNVEPDSPQLKQTIQNLVAHHVAITSTLAVLEGSLRPPMDRNGLMGRTRMLLVPEAWSKVMTNRAGREAAESLFVPLLQKEMKFEREFVAAGGLLMAGCDPTGDGHTLAGLGDQRNIELLAEAGFSPAEAIHIATQNGATFLGESERIGTVAPGKQADLVLLNGDLAKDITTIEKPELVFKAGVGYDSNAIYQSLRGKVGRQ